MSFLSGLNIAYQLILQKTNVNNDILSTTPVQVQVPLPNGIIGDNTVLVPNGAVDQVAALITAGLSSGQQFVDYVFLYSDTEVSFKLQGPGSTPITLRAGGVALLDSKNITSMLLSNASGLDATVEFLQARTQPKP